MILLPIALVVFSVPSSAAFIDVYIEAPGVMTTTLTGTNMSTDTFNTAAAGNYGSGNSKTLAWSTIGTYSTTGLFQIRANDQYGGASTPTVGTGQRDQYIVFGAESGNAGPMTLTLANSYNYFGFWWSAGDANNGISFYSGNVFLGRISTADLTRLLPKTNPVQVAAVTGQTYSSAAYYGNPSTTNNGQNNTEPYVYLDLFVQGSTYNRIVFDNSGSTGTGFESDNHTVGTVNQPNQPPFASPEPSAITLIVSGGIFVALGIVRKRASREPLHPQ